ncbi:hypothetical protein FACS18949_16800 [Clostridia bacterium]|nr:hypothetical protein FACS18949_16800 [Clostridia bacterium]
MPFVNIGICAAFSNSMGSAALLYFITKNSSKQITQRGLYRFENLLIGH